MHAFRFAPASPLLELTPTQLPHRVPYRLPSLSTTASISLIHPLACKPYAFIPVVLAGHCCLREPSPHNDQGMYSLTFIVELLSFLHFTTEECVSIQFCLPLVTLTLPGTDFACKLCVTNLFVAPLEASIQQRCPSEQHTHALSRSEYGTVRGLPLYYKCWRCVCLHTGYKVVAFKYMLLTLLLLRILKFQVSLHVPLQDEPLKMSAVGTLCVWEQFRPLLDRILWIMADCFQNHL